MEPQFYVSDFEKLRVIKKDRPRALIKSAMGIGRKS